MPFNFQQCVGVKVIQNIDEHKAEVYANCGDPAAGGYGLRNWDIEKSSMHGQSETGFDKPGGMVENLSWRNNKKKIWTWQKALCTIKL